MKKSLNLARKTLAPYGVLQLFPFVAILHILSIAIKIANTKPEYILASVIGVCVLGIIMYVATICAISGKWSFNFCVVTVLYQILTSVVLVSPRLIDLSKIEFNIDNIENFKFSLLVTLIGLLSIVKAKKNKNVLIVHLIAITLVGFKRIIDIYKSEVDLQFIDLVDFFKAPLTVFLIIKIKSINWVRIKDNVFDDLTSEITMDRVKKAYAWSTTPSEESFKENLAEIRKTLLYVDNIIKRLCTIVYGLDISRFPNVQNVLTITHFFPGTIFTVVLLCCTKSISLSLIFVVIVESTTWVFTSKEERHAIASGSLGKMQVKIMSTLPTAITAINISVKGVETIEFSYTCILDGQEKIRRVTHKSKEFAINIRKRSTDTIVATWEITKSGSIRVVQAIEYGAVVTAEYASRGAINTKEFVVNKTKVAVDYAKENPVKTGLFLSGLTAIAAATYMLVRSRPTTKSQESDEESD